LGAEGKSRAAIESIPTRIELIAPPMSSGSDRRRLLQRGVFTLPRGVVSLKIALGHEGDSTSHRAASSLHLEDRFNPHLHGFSDG
jgi:hypothetical protein